MIAEIIMSATIKERATISAVISSSEDLPSFQIVLTRPGTLEIPEAHWGNVVLCGSSIDGDLSAVELEELKEGVHKINGFWLVNPTFKKDPEFMNYMQRAEVVFKNMTYSTPKFLFATQDIIHSINNKVVLNQPDQDEEDKHAHLSETGTSTLFDTIVKQSYELNASDIHFHIKRDKAWVDIRVHGVMRKLRDLRSSEYAIEFVRTMYNSLSESSSRSIPNFISDVFAEASIRRSYGDIDLSFRYQQAPISPDGLDVVLRIIVERNHSEKMRLVSREEAGYSKTHDREISRMCSRSTGIVIVCGIVNSGKSTTLGNEVRRIIAERPGNVTRTIEDPVENIIPGASQIPVKRIGKDSNEDPFNSALAACMRMDNNTIMIGEIRNAETARISKRAVLTGHQILTTLHAASANEAITRLQDLGIDTQSLGSKSFISGIVYQKLMPVLCPNCKVSLSKAIKLNPKKYTGALVRRIHHAVGKEAFKTGRFYITGDGCNDCAGTGIIGRTLCAETITPSVKIRSAWGHAEFSVAEQIWRSQWKPDWNNFAGKTAFEHAISKMLKGDISPIEIELNFHRFDAEVGFDVLKSRLKKVSG